MDVKALLSGGKRKRAPPTAFKDAPKLFDDDGGKHKSLKQRIRSLQRLLAKPVRVPWCNSDWRAPACRLGGWMLRRSRRTHPIAVAGHCD